MRHRKRRVYDINQFWLEFGTFGTKEFKVKGRNGTDILKSFNDYMREKYGIVLKPKEKKA